MSKDYWYEFECVNCHKHFRTLKNVKVYPYNNGGADSTGGKVEIRAGSKVIILPDDAKIELQK